MDGVYLTCREKRLLFVMRFRKKIKPKFDVSHLISCGLIDHTYSGRKNMIGEHVPDDTYSLTAFERRWRIANRQDRWQRIVTPIFVSVASSVITAAITAIVTVLLMEQ